MKTRQFSILSGIALATSGMVFGLCLPSSALTWNWSYSGGGSIGGSGTFTTTDGPEPFTITGITGTVEGSTITSLLPPDSLGGNDNLLSTSQPQLTFSGVSFEANGEPWNLFENFSNNLFTLNQYLRQIRGEYLTQEWDV
jgi:hypothetical protein